MLDVLFYMSQVLGPAVLAGLGSSRRTRGCCSTLLGADACSPTFFFNPARKDIPLMHIGNDVLVQQQM